MRLWLSVMANPAECLHIKQGNLLYAIGCTWQALAFLVCECVSQRHSAPVIYPYFQWHPGIRRQHTDNLYRTNTTYAANIW